MSKYLIFGKKWQRREIVHPPILLLCLKAEGPEKRKEDQGEEILRKQEEENKSA